MVIRKAREFGRITRYKFLMNGALFRGILFLTYTKHEDAARALKDIGPKLRDCVAKRFNGATVRWAKTSQKPTKTDQVRQKLFTKASKEEFKDTWTLVNQRIVTAISHIRDIFSNAPKKQLDSSPQEDIVIAPPRRSDRVLSHKNLFI